MADVRADLEQALAGRYRVDRELGSGGMATVYLAEDLKHHRPIALKVLKPELAAVLGPERFLREIELAARLTHPHILPLHDSGNADGFLYYTMPYVEGESLRDRLRREKQLPVEDALQISREVADALSYAHAHGVIHRDIKPENILLESGHAVVADFGIARAIDQAGGEQLTATGMALGTPAYMSPEQAAGSKDLDGRSDIYALGCVLYEMLAGQTPFTGPTLESLIQQHLTAEPPHITGIRPAVPAHVAATLDRALAKTPADRFSTAMQYAQALAPPGPTVLPPRSPGRHDSRQAGVRVRRSSATVRYLLPGAAAITLLVVAASVTGLFGRRSQRWVRERGLPELRQLVDRGVLDSGYVLAREMEKTGAGGPELAALWGDLADSVTFESEPAGADVYRKAYAAVHAEWEFLGTTPLTVVHFPRGISRIRIVRAGYREFERVCCTQPVVVVRLQPSNGPDVVFVEGQTINLEGFAELSSETPVDLSPFLIDRLEVTNQAYRAFVVAGGYRRPEYWGRPFVREGRVIGWEQAMAYFVDATGKPGPSTWEIGDYPPGEGELPVVGVRWYEAMAYAKFTGRDLPTIFHWLAAARRTCCEIIPLSNLDGKAPAAVGQFRGVSDAGLLDVAGNAREWVYNARGDERFIMGGGWNDPAFAFVSEFTMDPFDRSPSNGFRLATFLDTSNLSIARRKVVRLFRDYRTERPVSNDIFSIYRRQFWYDHRPLNAVVEASDTTPDWIREHITFDAAYGSGRMALYLYLPRTTARPLQTVMFFPGSSAIGLRSIDDYRTSGFDFLVKAGRVVAFPVYQGTFRRGDRPSYTDQDESNSYREHVVQWGKDLARSIDYLETRPDLAADRLAYFGHSWGARLGGILLAVEPRIKVAVLRLGGFNFTPTQPEVDPLNYVTRIKVPVLMLNARYDVVFPLETSARPMFDLLGTPAQHKRHVISDNRQVLLAWGHDVPRTTLITETLAWYDRYLGAPTRSR
jgi:formylglycine-generating enzyme required for sulfatase activity/dienelactone hydrolase